MGKFDPGRAHVPFLPYVLPLSYLFGGNQALHKGGVLSEIWLRKLYLTQMPSLHK